MAKRAETLGNRLANAKSKKAVDSLSDTLAKVEAETLGNILGDLEAKHCKWPWLTC